MKRMRVEVIGILTILLGFSSLMLAESVIIVVLVCSTLLAASSALVLTGFGSASIQPSHLLLGFAAVSAVLRRGNLGRAAHVLSVQNGGFWLLLTVLHGLVSAILFPRLFAGLTDVFAISREQLSGRVILVPLAPTSGNVTQSVYFFGDLICFVTFAVYVSGRPQAFGTVARAFLLCAGINLLFAVVDLVTFWTGTGYVLDVIRNGTYTMLNEASVSGVKRIVGSFTEASGYAYTTLGLFAFTLQLWMNGVYPRVSSTLASLSCISLLFSTSTTAYAGLGLYLLLTYGLSAARVLSKDVPKPVMLFVLVAPLLFCCVLLAARAYGPIWTAITDVLKITVFDKANTESGVERGSWNAQAMVNFVETSGFGVGLGSTRTSSFPAAVLSNIGVAGAVSYSLFFLLTLLKRGSRHEQEDLPERVQGAARSACVALILAASASGGMVDLGLPFFIFSGVACARLVARPHSSSRRSGQADLRYGDSQTASHAASGHHSSDF